MIWRPGHKNQVRGLVLSHHEYVFNSDNLENVKYHKLFIDTLLSLSKGPKLSWF